MLEILNILCWLSLQCTIWVVSHQENSISGSVCMLYFHVSFFLWVNVVESNFNHFLAPSPRTISSFLSTLSLFSDLSQSNMQRPIKRELLNLVVLLPCWCFFEDMRMKLFAELLLGQLPIWLWMVMNIVVLFYYEMF